MTLPNAWFDVENVVEIKKAIFEGATLQALSKKYKVCYQTISHIKCGRTWSDVEWPDGSKP